MRTADLEGRSVEETHAQTQMHIDTQVQRQTHAQAHTQTQTETKMQRRGQVGGRLGPLKAPEGRVWWTGRTMRRRRRTAFTPAGDFVEGSR